MLTLLLITSRCFCRKFGDCCMHAPLLRSLIINRPLRPIATQSVSPKWWCILCINTLSPLNDYVSHRSTLFLLNDYGSHDSTLFTPQLWCLPWIPPIFPPSNMMAPSWLIGSIDGIASSQINNWIGWKKTFGYTWEHSGIENISPPLLHPWSNPDK